jgi:hypothetical protein
MKSLMDLVTTEEIGERPISIKSLLQIHNASELSVKSLLASHEMLIEYKRSPKWVLALGPISGGIMKDDSGSYKIPAKFGFLLKPLTDGPEGPTHGPTEARGEYEVAVSIAAVKCFGTEDPGLLGPAEDEVYGYVTLFALMPGKQEQVKVTRLKRQNEVKKGDVIYKSEPIGKVALMSGTTGLKIHMILLEREHLEPQTADDEIFNAVRKINAIVGGTATAITLKAPNKVTAIIAAASAITAALLEIKVVEEFVKLLNEPLAAIFKDDRIGQKTFNVTPAQLEAWSTDEGYTASKMRAPGVLGPDVAFNFPADIDNPEWLFNEGGSTYKVHFDVHPKRVGPYPIDKN